MHFSFTYKDISLYFSYLYDVKSKGIIQPFLFNRMETVVPSPNLLSS